MKPTWMMLACCAALFAQAGVYVDCEPDATFHARTCSAERTTVHWLYPDGAKSARLVVTDMKGQAVTNVIAAATADSCSWAPPAPAAEAEEVVYDVTLDFFRSTDATGTPLAGKSLAAYGIGAVRTASVPVRIAEVDSSSWLRVKTHACVLPVPAGATALARDGVARTDVAAPGWAGWSDVSDTSETRWELDAVTRLLRGDFSGFTFFVR